MLIGCGPGYRAHSQSRTFYKAASQVASQSIPGRYAWSAHHACIASGSAVVGLWALERTYLFQVIHYLSDAPYLLVLLGHTTSKQKFMKLSMQWGKKKSHRISTTCLLKSDTSSNIHTKAEKVSNSARRERIRTEEEDHINQKEAMHILNGNKIIQPGSQIMSHPFSRTTRESEAGVATIIELSNVSTEGLRRHHLLPGAKH